LKTKGLGMIFLAFHQPDQFVPTTREFYGAAVTYVSPSKGERLNETHVNVPNAYYTLKASQMKALPINDSCFYEDEMEQTLNECYSDHVTKAMNTCQVPWLTRRGLLSKSEDQMEKPLCHTDEEYDQLKSLANSLNTMDEYEGARLTGCRPTCNMNQYTASKMNWDYRRCGKSPISCTLTFFPSGPFARRI